MECCVKTIYSRYMKKRDTKPFILLLGSNSLREIISYMSHTDFLEFCICCKKLHRFFSDKFVSFNLNIPKVLIPDSTSEITPIIEEKFVRMLMLSYYPALNIFWKEFPIKYFHYAIYDLRKFVFVYHHKIFEIKEIVSFSTELNSTFSYEFEAPILGAVGYKNRVLFWLKDKLVYLKLNHESEILNRSMAVPERIEFEIPKSEKRIKEFHFFNSGRNVILVFLKAVYVLNDKLMLVSIYREEDFRFFLPAKEGRTYVIIKGREMRIKKLHVLEDVIIHTKESVVHILASNLNHTPELFHSDSATHLYLNNHYLSYDILANFLIYREFIVFQISPNYNTATIFNFQTQALVYTFPLPVSGIVEFIDFSVYRVLFKIRDMLYMHSLITQTNFIFEIRHPEQRNLRMYSNILVMECHVKDFYAVLTLDFYRQMKIEEFDKAAVAPVDEEKEEFERKLRIREEQRIKAEEEREARRKEQMRKIQEFEAEAERKLQGETKIKKEKKHHKLHKPSKH